MPGRFRKIPIRLSFAGRAGRLQSEATRWAAPPERSFQMRYALLVYEDESLYGPDNAGAFAYIRTVFAQRWIAMRANRPRQQRQLAAQLSEYRSITHSRARPRGRAPA